MTEGGSILPEVVVAAHIVGGLVVSTVLNGASATNQPHTGHFRTTFSRAPCPSVRISIPSCGPTFDRSAPVSHHVPPHPRNRPCDPMAMACPRVAGRTTVPQYGRDGRHHGYVAPTGTRVVTKSLPRFET